MPKVQDLAQGFIGYAPKRTPTVKSFGARKYPILVYVATQQSRKTLSALQLEETFTDSFEIFFCFFTFMAGTQPL